MSIPTNNYASVDAATYTSPWNVETDDTRRVNGHSVFSKDTSGVSTDSTSEVNKNAYVAFSDKPNLPPPVSDVGGASITGQSSGLESIDFMNMSLSDFTTKMTGTVGNMLSDISVSSGLSESNPLADALSASIDGLSDADLKALDPSRTPEQVRALLFFAAAHPEAVVTPEVRAAAAILIDSAMTETGLPFDSEALTALDGMLALMQNESLVAAMSKMDLPKEIKDLLVLAASIPALAEALPAELKAILAELKGVVDASINIPYGVPAGWQMTDGAELALMEGAKFDQQVISKLKDMLEDGKITPEQFNKMRSDYYLGTETSSSAVGAIVKELQAGLQLPEGYRFPVDKELFKAMLDGATVVAFKQKLSEVKPPLTADQQAQLLAALGGQKSVDLPADLQAVFAKAKIGAIDAVKGQFQLPGAWMPNVEGLGAAAVNLNTPEMILRQSGIDTVKEMKALSLSLTEQLAVKTGRISTTINITDYLGAVSAALLGLQETLYAVSAANAETVRRMNVVNRDTVLSKLDAKKKQLEDIKNAHNKQQIQAVAGQYGMMVGMIVLMVFCPYLIPMILAIMVAMIVAMIIGAMKGGKLDATNGPFELAAEGAGLPVKAIWIMLSVLCPLLMLIASIVDLMFMGGKSIIDPVLKVYGVSQAVRSKITMALQMIMIVAVIIAMIVCMVVPGLQGASVALAQSLGSTFAAIAGGIGSGAAALGSAMGSTAQMVVQVIISLAVRLAQIISRALTFAANALEKLGSLGKALSSGLKTAANSVDDFIKAGKDAIKMIDAGKSLNSTVAELMKNTARLLERLENGVAKYAGMVTDKVEQGLGQLFSGVGKAITAIADKLAIRQALDWVVNNFNKLVNYIVQQWDDLIRGMGLDQSKQVRVLNAELNIAKNDADNLARALKGASVDDHAELTTRLAVANQRVRNLEQGIVSLESELASGAATFVLQANVMLQTISGVIQTGWSVHNKVLEARIAMIKAEYEAYAREVEVFLKILGVALNRVMEQLQDIGEMIKKLVEMQKNMIKGMSDSMTRLSNA